MTADLDRLTDDVLHALTDGAAATPEALLFLLRRYRATDRADVRAALEPSLAAALDQPFDARSRRDRAAFLRVFVEAAAVADDPRVSAAVAALAANLRAGFGSPIRVDESFAIVEACLIAADVLDPRTIVPNAIDELERIIGATYRPGGGLAYDRDAAGGSRGALGDHVLAASALLTAYRATARIPYAMLAEELMQFARRTLWHGDTGAFTAGAGACDGQFTAICAAARVWCRLAALHAEDDYRAAAVIVPDAAYLAEAAGILNAPAITAEARGLAGATYGLALAEWLGL